MSVRAVELLMAVALALLSIAFMIKATDGLSIWWVPGIGPGSGVWPFWLSLLMLLSCLTIILRWFLGVTPQSRSTELFMDRHAAQVVGITVAALFLLILGTYYIGIYFSLILFLLFYLRVLGGHTWLLTITLMLSIPVVIFFFFEYALTIPLPKGGWIPDQVYIPLYRIMYGY
jgi:putative tricarboxylic transport membrane protein